jgi:hypothetical protein
MILSWETSREIVIDQGRIRYSSFGENWNAVDRIQSAEGKKEYQIYDIVSDGSFLE